MKRQEIKPYKGSRVRISYINKVGAINSMCGVLVNILTARTILQPFGSNAELLIYIDRILDIERINGH